MIASLKQNSLVRALTSDKLVSNRLLNRAGIQVFRTLAARSVYNLRSSRTTPEIDGLVNQVRNDGMFLIHDFLAPDVFEQVSEECISAFDEDHIHQLHHGPTTIDLAAFRKFDAGRFPLTEKHFFSDPRVHQVLQAVEKQQFSIKAGHRAVERVRQGETTDGDPETDLHSDTFFHTHKAWLYLTDVTPKDAPLVYVKGSHRLSMEQLRRVYGHSCDPVTNSRRITLDEMKKLGFEETVVACPKNTLVLANVCGYHRRSVGEPGGERMAVHISLRAQPFFWWKHY